MVVAKLPTLSEQQDELQAKFARLMSAKAPSAAPALTSASAARSRGRTDPDWHDDNITTTAEDAQDGGGNDVCGGS